MRAGHERYTKRENDLATVGECADMIRRGINHAINRLVAERIEPLERPWWKFWRKRDGR